MGQPIQEPSMEDILASIKRIIAEDSEAAVARSPRARKGPVAVPDPAPPPAIESEPAPPEAVAEPEPAPVAEPTAREPSIIDPTAAEPITPEQAAPDPIIHEPSDVLELTSPLVEPFEEPVMPAPVADRTAPADPAPAAKPAEGGAAILSAPAETASRNAFAALSQLQMRSTTGQENTLEGLVGDLLRPMLRDWLDANLPAIVERIVEAEVKRVSGRG